MKRHWILAMIFIVFSLCLGTIAFAEGTDEKEPTGERIIVVYKYDELERGLMQSFEKGDIAEVKRDDKYTPLEKLYEKQIEASELVLESKGVRTEQITLKETVDVDEYMEMLESRDGIEIVERDYELEYLDEVNDPYYQEQWHLNEYEFLKLWNLVGDDGDDVTVAVLDSGIDEYHEDLIGRIDKDGYNFGDRNDILTDYAGHGTAVSGIISAVIDNGKGVAGVAGDLPIKILPLKVEDIWGRMYVSYAIAAIDYAIEQDVDIINISSGVSQYSYAYHRAIQRATDAGIMVFASAGNFRQSGNPLFYPAAYEESISVGSAGIDDDVSYFSESNEYVDFVGPGEDILTTRPYDEYDSASGTSFSAPFVAATAAILKSLNDDLSSEEIKALLIETALDLGEEGKDDDYGYGLIQPLKAVEQLIQEIQGSAIPDENWKDWENQITDDVKKIWNITFNQAIDVDSLSDKTIIVRDELNKKVDVLLQVSIDGRTLEILPINDYIVGKSYKLYISSEVKSNDGKFLNSPIRMTFTVK